MLAENAEFQESLLRIVRSLCRNQSSHADLMQELMIRVCQLELATPARTWKWCLRNCWFFLHDILRHDRRKDRLRDHTLHFAAPADIASMAGFEEQFGLDDSFF